MGDRDKQGAAANPALPAAAVSKKKRVENDASPTGVIITIKVRGAWLVCVQNRDPPPAWRIGNTTPKTTLAWGANWAVWGAREVSA
jgi:hypothetical protein